MPMAPRQVKPSRRCARKIWAAPGPVSQDAAPESRRCQPYGVAAPPAPPLPVVPPVPLEPPRPLPPPRPDEPPAPGVWQTCPAPIMFAQVRLLLQVRIAQQG
jgi:hypothetical protein